MQKATVTKITGPGGEVTWDVDITGEPDGDCFLNQLSTPPEIKPEFECLVDNCTGRCDLIENVVSPTVTEYWCQCDPSGGEG